MSEIRIPKNYRSPLDLYETQYAIGTIKRLFEDNLAGALNLRRASAPLFVEGYTGLNDDLNGVERPVDFDIPDTGGSAQVVHSLAKWKRMALYRYGFSAGEGIYTDMNAIRRDETLDNLHSIYVDQWDWEKVITRKQRNLDYLKDTVISILGCITVTHDTIKRIFPQLTFEMDKNISFITSQELEDLYPSLSPEQREDEYLRKHNTAFIMQIGAKLRSGIPHSGRAPDYDDWSLNGDLLIYSPLLDKAVEITSMGIRVDCDSMRSQLEEAGCTSRSSLTFHKMLLENRLPLTVGGGIGQSRLCMLLLQKAHIGEVQVSVWDDKTIKACEAAGIELL